MTAGSQMAFSVAVVHSAVNFSPSLLHLVFKGADVCLLCVRYNSDLLIEQILNHSHNSDVLMCMPAYTRDLCFTMASIVARPCFSVA